jgi:hypothetical protein
MEALPRHRGGSSVDKFFLDGRRFAASSQNRDVSVPDDPAPGFAYVADGCLCHSTAAATWIQGSPGPFLLADLVENHLLFRARERGWVQCHAAAWVLPDGRAVLAAGDSGYGKTTALLRAVQGGARFLSNDRLFLREQGGRLQARGYPLAMNIGCGTLRALGLPYPHRGLPDDAKLRLTAQDVQRDYAPDYAGWFDVGTVHGKSFEDLLGNCFYAEDDATHPRWNPVWRGRCDEGRWASVARALMERFSVRPPVSALSTEGA